MNKNIADKLAKLDVSYGTRAALFSERLYQEMIWNKDTTSSGGNHSDLEFLVFIDDYLRESINIVSRNPEPEASNNASENIRKISAMILASAEKNHWIDDLLELGDTILMDDKFPDYSVVETLAVIKGFINKGFEQVITSRNSTFVIRQFFAEIFFVSVSCMSNHHAICRTLPISQGLNSKIEKIKKEAFDESINLFVDGAKNDRQVSIYTTDEAINYINTIINKLFTS